MEPSACPVCTLYLREGISLYNHLETHPKEQVIEALIRSQEVQSQHLVNVPTTQATPFYQTPAQCFPVQQFSGNTFTYQQILPNSGMNSSMAPVTMLMPPSSNPNLMQMVYNPFLMQQQQQQQQQQVQLVNSPNNLPIQQQTTLQRTVYANPNVNPDARQVLHSSDPIPVQINTPVSESFTKTQPRCYANTAFKGVITALPSQSPNYHFLPKPQSPNKVRPASCNSEMHPSAISSAQTPSENSIASSSKLPIFKFSTDTSLGNSENRSNKIQIVRILPNSPNLHTTRINNQHIPKTVSETTTHWTNSNIEVKVTQAPNSCPPNLITELRDLIANKSIELTPLPSQSATSENDNRVLVPSSTSLDTKHDILDTLKVGPANKRKRSPSNSVNSQMKRSATTNMRQECMDIELSRIDLTDLAEKDYYTSQPCGSRQQECDVHLTAIEQGNALNYGEESQDYPTDISCASGHKSVSPRLELRRNLSIEGDYTDLDSKSHLELLTTGQEYDQSLSPASDQKSGRTSPALSYVSSTDGGSPGLRIRTDLSNKSMQAFPTHSLSTSPVEMINNLLDDSNEASDFVDIVQNNLRIQSPPVCATDNEEYIISDCAFHTNDNEIDDEDGTSSQMITSRPHSRFSNRNDESGNCTETTRYESASPINIIEIDGIHIMVPSQFYEKPGEGSQDDNMVTSELDLEKDQHSPAVHVEPEVDCKRDVIREARELAMESDDMNVSTSYDLLARESWAESDGSDNEGNDDCNIMALDPTWEDVVESRPRVEKRNGRGRPPKLHKCAVCSKTFNCPKELRVHRSIHVSNKVIPSEVEPVPSETTVDCANELLVMKEEKVTTSKIRKKLNKSLKMTENSRVVFVKNEAENFMGVFVQEDGVAHIDDDLERKIEHDAMIFPGGSEIKTETKPTLIKVEEKLLKCLTCPELFAYRKLLIRHVRLDHSTVDGKHMCDTCQEIFAEEIDYNIHLKKHPLECRSCSKNFYRRQNLLLHMKRHLGVKPHVCHLCTKSFVTKQKLNEHLNSHTGASPIKCPLCPMGFRRYSNLIQHKNRFHLKLKKKVKDYVCFCGEIFHSKKKLEWHKEIHERKPKCCSFCSERFVHSASLTRHIRRAHDRRYMPKVGREGENVECSICGHVFLKSSLQVHMRLHNGERPFSCAICNKQFTTKWNLQQHRWTHMSRSNKPFKCTLCKSAFSRESDYTQHMDSHRNKRQYTCNVCGEQFVRKNNCQRHVKEHEAEKTFACKECGKKFHRNYYLKDHMRVHSGSRPFSCHICGKASSTKSNHNKHVKIHHAREPVNTES